jgi:hypothetical protein
MAKSSKHPQQTANPRILSIVPLVIYVPNNTWEKLTTSSKLGFQAIGNI